VTQDPNARLKPSGIKSLGDVPDHWQIKRAKYLFREIDERSTTGLEELLSVSHLAGVTPRSQKNVTMFKAASYVGQKTCCPGDLVINTMWAWMGALGISRYAGIVSSAYGVYRPLRESLLTIDYADLLLRARPYVTEYICRSTGIRSSRLRLYPEQFLTIPLCVPPIEEQRQLVRFVLSETKQLSAIIASTQREISLLREYRTRLIADVVSGKLDVRAAAAPLPEDEGEPFDVNLVVSDNAIDEEEAAFAEADDA
jgi:type I restriction enzyme, S subunit